MPSTNLHAPEDQPVTFVELFFDLVFVFAVTQVTGLTAHHLDLGGVARSGLLFWLIWWAWTQFTWTLSPADTEHTVVRAWTLVATAAGFVMAASVSGAFGDDGLWFAVPYIFIRLIGMGLQIRIDRETSSEHSVSPAWLYFSVAGLAAVLAGAIVDPPVRNWSWLVVVAIDLTAARSATGTTTWDLKPRHFSERHGLFVILALGESLIVAGTAVVEHERTVELTVTAGAALAVVCLLWWTYFGQLKQALEERFDGAHPADIGPIARDAYSLCHFPLIGGIIGVAVALEELLLHPEEAASGAVIASLTIGVGLFVGASALAYWRISHRVLTTRIIILAATVAGVGASGAANAKPVVPLTIVAIGLLATVLAEGLNLGSTDEAISFD